MAATFRVCAIGEIPDSGMRAFDVVGLEQPVLIAVVAGEIFATAGICPHEDVALVSGVLAGREVVCPGHGYRLDLATGACTPNRRLRLSTYRPWIEDGALWIDLFPAS